MKRTLPPISKDGTINLASNAACDDWIRAARLKKSGDEEGFKKMEADIGYTETLYSFDVQFIEKTLDGIRSHQRTVRAVSMNEAKALVWAEVQNTPGHRFSYPLEAKRTTLTPLNKH